MDNLIKISIILMFFAMLFTADASAQLSVPYNTDFEEGFAGSPVFGWSMGSTSLDSGFVAVETDSLPYSGYFCAAVINSKKQKPKDIVASFFQTLDAATYRGKRIRFTIMIKAGEPDVNALSIKDTNDIRNYMPTFPPRAFVNVRNADDKIVARKQSAEVFVRGWQKAIVEVDIPQSASDIRYGVNIADTNTIYVDECTIEVMSDDSLLYEAPSPLTSIEGQYLFNFANIGGGIQYFHPSKVASEANWDNVMLAGVKQANNLSEQGKIWLEEKNATETINAKIKDSLTAFFKQLAPDIVISKNPINTKSFTQPKHKYLLAWQHTGIPTNVNANNMTNSRIVNLNGALKYSDAVVTRYIELDSVRGDELAVAVKVKLHKFHKGAFATLSLRFEDWYGNYLSFLGPDTASKADEWQEIVIKGKVPDSANKGLIILTFQGYGEAYFDEVKAFSKDDKYITNIPVINAGFEQDLPFDHNNWQTVKRTYEGGYQLAYSEEHSAGKKSLALFTDSSQTPEFPKQSWFTTSVNSYIANKPELFNQFGIDNNFNIVPQTLYVAYPLFVPAEFFEHKSKDINDNPIVNVTYETYPQSSGFTYGNGKDSNFVLSWQDRASRLVNVMKCYNLIKHFSLTEIESQVLDSAFIVALKASAVANSKEEYREIIADFLEITNDNRTRVWFTGVSSYKSSLPFTMTMIGDKIFVERVDSANAQNVSIGDEIVAVENTPILEYLKIDSSTPQWKIERDLSMLRHGEKDTKLSVTIKHNGTSTTNEYSRNIPARKLSYRTTESSVVFNDSILYIDLTMYKEEEIDTYFGGISKYNNFIFDLRGETMVSENFLSLIYDKIYPSSPTCIPYFTAPEHSKMSYNIINTFYYPAETKRLEGKCVFLIDWKTYGNGELFADLVKAFGIGQLVGNPTQGTLTAGIGIRLDMDLSISLGTMYGYNMLGIPLLKNPVQPDIAVTKTLDAIGTDAILQRALECFK